MSYPRYPNIEIELASDNPLAWVSAVRQALRRAGAGPGEICRFTADALGTEEPDRIRQVCCDWARLRTS